MIYIVTASCCWFFSSLLSDIFHDDPSVPHSQSQNQNPPKFPTCSSADGDMFVFKMHSPTIIHMIMAQTYLVAVMPVMAPRTAVQFPHRSPR